MPTLLFARTLEPLACIIRSNSTIQGFTAHGIEERISLYADDVLLYITDPPSTIATLFYTLEKYGKHAGYKINWNKSVLYQVGGPQETYDLPRDLQVSTEGFKYLGMYISTDATQCLMRNIRRVVADFCTDVERWRRLPLTLLGRAAMYKIISLPKLLYSRQNTHYKIPEEVFRAIDNGVRTLLWDGGQPRIALRTLQRTSYNRGIALPVIRAYYRAAHLIVLNEWGHLPRTHSKYTLEQGQFETRSHLHYIYGGRGVRNLLPATQRVLEGW